MKKAQVLLAFWPSLFVLQALLFSCQSKEAELPAQPVAKKQVKRKEKTLTIEEQVSNIKLQLDSTPLFPPTFSRYLPGKDKKNYTLLIYGEAYNPKIIYSDLNGEIKLIRVEDHYGRYDADYFYYFVKARLKYFFCRSNGLNDDELSNCCCYFENDSLIFCTTQNYEYAGNLFKLDSAGMKKMDLSVPENAARGDTLLKRANKYLQEAKVKIEQKTKPR